MDKIIVVKEGATIKEVKRGIVIDFTDRESMIRYELCNVNACDISKAVGMLADINCNAIPEDVAEMESSETGGYFVEAETNTIGI